MLRVLLRHAAAKPLVLLALLMPVAWWVWGVFNDALGANPAEYLIRASGDWTLRTLCLALAITPLRVGLGWPELARFRRMLGLTVYFYATLHLFCYSGMDMGFEVSDIARDIVKRPFIWMGFSAWVLLTPLAATSFNAAIRRLGAKRWHNLHKAVYGVACLAVLHFYWMRSGKQNFTEVWVYGVILGSLLLWRVRRWRAGS
jgi:sulfoxide reductase heme-binding subunit YedZ